MRISASPGLSFRRSRFAGCPAAMIAKTPISDSATPTACPGKVQSRISSHPNSSTIGGIEACSRMLFSAVVVCTPR